MSAKTTSRNTPPVTSSRNFSYKIQKKLLGQFCTRRTVKVFLSVSLSTMLDLLFELIETFTGEKKEAEDVINGVIQISVRIALLFHNDLFSPEEILVAHKMEDKTQTILIKIMNFIEADCPYDRNFLMSSFQQYHLLLLGLVKSHLSESSMKRIQRIQTLALSPDFLDTTFRRGTPENDILIKIMETLRRAIDKGEITLQ